MRQVFVSVWIVAVAFIAVVRPAGAGSVVKPSELRIPPSAFPTASSFAVDRVETNKAIRLQASGRVDGGFLPTWFFSDRPKQLGRISGYAQVAVWSEPGPSSVGYVSTLASIYPDAASAAFAYYQAVVNIKRLRSRFGHINVTSSFPTLGDRDSVFRLTVKGAASAFNFYLLTFSRASLEFEDVLAVPVALGRQPAHADLVKLVLAEDDVAARAQSSAGASS